MPNGAGSLVFWLDCMNKVKIDATRITDWDSFHDIFSECVGFPACYGRNMEA